MDATGNTIFIIEDDEDYRELLKEILDELNNEVKAIIFSDGDQLFDCLVQTETHNLPSLIILDYNLPGLNGEAILLMLIKDPRFRHIPVIVYSTFLLQEIAENLLKLGAVNCMQKPSTIEEFHQMVNNFIETASAAHGD